MDRRTLLALSAVLGLLVGGCASTGAVSPQPTILRTAIPTADSTAMPDATPGPTTTAVAPETPAASPQGLWPAPPNPLVLALAAGLVPETKESLAFHVHAHLDVIRDGVPVIVPAGIGIDITNPGVNHGTLPDGSDAYGGIAGCDRPCISPLHTHDISGVLHTESKTPTPNTLGQFFTEWGVALTPNCVGQFCRPAIPIAIYLDGKPFAGDPTAIELADQLEIAIVIGAPPAVIPSTFSGT